MDLDKLVEKLKRRLKSLKDERDSWLSDWKDLAEKFLPRKMFVLDQGDQTNEGGINNTLYDSASIRAMRVLAAGMQGGMTSPARPWLRLSIDDLELKENSAVKEWLAVVQREMLSLFSKSNFYSAIYTRFLELATFGTAAMYEVEDPETVIRFIPLTIGEYYAATDFDKRIKTLFREYEATAEQIVNQFGEDNVSQVVKESNEDPARKDNYYTIVHVCLPNPDYEEGRLGYEGKLYLSLYWEDKTADIDKPYLSVGGFDEQPFVVPRWDVKGNNVYGDSPAMDALPDVKQLQSQTKSLMKALQKEVDPPMNAPPGMKNASIVPGAINYIPVTGGQAFTPAIAVKSNPQGTMVAIQETKEAIKEDLYNDLFKMLAIAGGSMTATEVRERVEEKLILLGPVLERLQSELLTPVVDRTFGIMYRNQRIPEPPEELQGRELKVEYVSLLAQAQKAVGTMSIEQFMRFISASAQMYQEALDIMDIDETAEEYAELLGVPPGMIRGKDERDEIRQFRAQQQQAVLQAQAESQRIDDMKKLSEVDLGSDNALGAMTETIAG